MLLSGGGTVGSERAPSVPQRLARSLTAICGLLLASAAGAGAAEHPRLVDLESTRCDVCHADRLDKPQQHPPAADDCTICHDMTIGAEGTVVELVDSEPQLCLVCHDDKEKAVAGELATPHFPVVDSCLTCHDPHSTDHERLLVEAVPGLCNVCHDNADLQEAHGEQLTSATDCITCHQPHGTEGPRLLKASHLHPPFAEGSCAGCHRKPFGQRVRLQRRGEALCIACHADKDPKVPEAEGGTIHPAMIGERGRPGCLGCHNPHMSDQGRLLVAGGPDLCRQCHQPVVDAARAETGHYPAGDDCLTCHLPHKSEQVRLLQEPAGDLCRTCHDPGDDELKATHLGAPLEELSCIKCHTPHGEGNPRLLAEHVHPPVLDGCDTCHEGSFDQQLEGGESALCLLCHDDIGELADNAEVPHFALEVGRCADCHNPHASPQEKLVKAPGAGPCGECHDDKLPKAGETAHGVIDVLGCRACHEPHGGSLPSLLRKPPPDLCLSCHSPGAAEIDEETGTARLLDHFTVPAESIRAMASLRLSSDGTRNHPVALHRVLGMPTEKELKRIETTHEGELTCLTCHDPHKGRTRLLRWNASSTMEACVQCHPK